MIELSETAKLFSILEMVDGFEAAETLEALQRKMQIAIEQFGFAAYNFFDAGKAHLDAPYFFGTTGKAWENEYRTNNFLVHDPTLAFARRTNLGFRWSEVSLPPNSAKRRTNAEKLMEAANDYGFEDGYIQPLHFVDSSGRSHTTLLALFWKDKVSELNFSLSSKRRHELNFLLIYWLQRALNLREVAAIERDTFKTLPTTFSHLTERERDVLTWAGRGRSAIETADILKIGQQTVTTHLTNTIQKLHCLNKTHAVAKAVHLGLIDL